MSAGRPVVPAGRPVAPRHEQPEPQHAGTAANIAGVPPAAPSFAACPARGSIHCRGAGRRPAAGSSASSPPAQPASPADASLFEVAAGGLCGRRVSGDAS